MEPQQLPLGERIGDLLTDPVFWISSVIIALAINIFSTYITRGIDKLLSLFFTHRKRISEKRNEFFNKQVNDLFRNSDEQNNVKLDMHYNMLRAIVSFLEAFLFLFLFTVLASLCIVVYILDMLNLPLLADIILVWFTANSFFAFIDSMHWTRRHLNTQADLWIILRLFSSRSVEQEANTNKQPSADTDVGPNS